MSSPFLRSACATALVLSLAGCKGATNDDENFFVLTFRASLSATGGQGTGPSTNPDMTPDGRYVVFESRAADLVPGDTNGKSDIFRKDLSTGEIVRVSIEDPSNPDGIDADGENANDNSRNPTISADGRFVAFESDANDLVLGDTNGTTDIFIRDMSISTLLTHTFRVSIEDPTNPDGLGDDENANEASLKPDISDDGRYVAYESDAPDLIVSDTNGKRDIFVRDTLFDVTTRVSEDTAGNEANDESFNASISGDGSVVAFDSKASNLIAAGLDINDDRDVFVRNWLSPTPTTTRVSVEDNGTVALPLDLDGDAGGDGDNPGTDGVPNDAFSSNPKLSGDGRFVVFVSTAADLVLADGNGTGVGDVFVRDRVLNTTRRVSVSTQGSEASLGGGAPDISRDGRWVVFQSSSPDLVLGDTNNAVDVFLRDTVQNTTIRISLATYGVETSPFFSSASPTISNDGRFVTFVSNAPNLAPNDSNGTFDVYVRGPLY